jgi:acyl-homoserine lactone acylase PvdQ
VAETEGESAIYSDLRQKLFIDSADLRVRYIHTPIVLKKQMQAWADDLNYYLAMHPTVAPRVIQRFEAWMVLRFSEGSIGLGDGMSTGSTGRVAASAQSGQWLDRKHQQLALFGGRSLQPQGPGLSALHG